MTDGLWDNPTGAKIQQISAGRLGKSTVLNVYRWIAPFSFKIYFKSVKEDL